MNVRLFVVSHLTDIQHVVGAHHLRIGIKPALGQLLEVCRVESHESCLAIVDDTLAFDPDFASLRIEIKDNH